METTYWWMTMNLIEANCFRIDGDLANSTLESALQRRPRLMGIAPLGEFSLVVI
jgi:hypothetical protein